jgi:hypothetical protein
MYSLKKGIPKKFKLGPLFKYEAFIRELSTTLCERRKNEKMYFVVHCPKKIWGKIANYNTGNHNNIEIQIEKLLGAKIKFLLSLGSMMT